MVISEEITGDNASRILVAYLVETGISQAEVAEKSKLNKNTVSSLVNDGGKSQVVTVEKLKKYFKSIGIYNG